MPTIAYTRPVTGNTALNVVQWPALAQGDDGAPLADGQYSDRSVQVAGTFDGASVRIEGSNDGENWATLTDPQGNDLLVTTAKIEAITEVSLRLRPVIVGGGASTALTVTVLCVESR